MSERAKKRARAAGNGDERKIKRQSFDHIQIDDAPPPNVRTTADLWAEWFGLCGRFAATVGRKEGGR